MALGMKAEGSGPRKLLGLFQATDEPSELTQKAQEILLLMGELEKGPGHSGAFSINTSKPIN